MHEQSEQSRWKRNTILAMFLIGLIYLICRPSDDLPRRLREYDLLSAPSGDFSELWSGQYTAGLPYEGTAVVPYERPDAEMPIFGDLFHDVEVTIDGKRIQKDANLRFKVGQQVFVQLVTARNPRIPINATMSANGAVFACKSQNKEGWMVLGGYFMGSNQSSGNVNRSEIRFVVPDLRGEFNFCILGDAVIGIPRYIPILMVRSYSAVIE